LAVEVEAYPLLLDQLKPKLPLPPLRVWANCPVPELLQVSSVGVKAIERLLAYTFTARTAAVLLQVPLPEVTDTL
jgi:hypothetical protein